jgi:hypothetical protein
VCASVCGRERERRERNKECFVVPPFWCTSCTLCSRGVYLRTSYHPTAQHGSTTGAPLTCPSSIPPCAIRTILVRQYPCAAVSVRGSIRATTDILRALRDSNHPPEPVAPTRPTSAGLGIAPRVKRSIHSWRHRQVSGGGGRDLGREAFLGSNVQRHAE